MRLYLPHAPSTKESATRSAIDRSHGRENGVRSSEDEDEIEQPSYTGKELFDSAHDKQRRMESLAYAAPKKRKSISQEMDNPAPSSAEGATGTGARLESVIFFSNIFQACLRTRTRIKFDHEINYNYSSSLF